MMAQAIELARRPHIIVCTPGRLRDHIASSDVDLSRLKFLVSSFFLPFLWSIFQVFDEADRLLSNSFGSDLGFILDRLPSSRQTLLFTATMTPAIESLHFSRFSSLLAHTFPSRSEPFIYRGNTRYDTVDTLHQTYLFVPSLVKDAYVNFILSSTYGMNPGAAKAEKSESGKPASKKRRKADSQAAITQSLEGKEDYTSVIIFTGRWKTCERLYLTLRELGIRCTAIHSRLSQNERLASIAKFKSGLVRILVTTDVGTSL